MSTTVILGYDVVFPQGKKPFPSQIAVISKCLMAFRKHQNALIESPTGTGKTLSLLTAALAYQKKEYALALEKQRAEERAAGPLKENAGAGASMTDHTKRVLVHNALHFPRIYYCSRTHSQIQQVVDELREMDAGYLVDLHSSILASRSHLCVNSEVRQRAEARGKSIESVCDEMLKKNMCGFRHQSVAVARSMFRGARGVGSAFGGWGVQQSRSTTGGSGSGTCTCNGDSLLQGSSVWDIEDIAAAGKKYKGGGE